MPTHTIDTDAQNWLLNTPPSDNNFKSHLKSANDETINAARLESLKHAGNKTRYEALAAELNRRNKASGEPIRYEKWERVGGIVADRDGKKTPTKVKLDTILDTEIGTLQMRTEVDSAHVDDLKDCLADLPPITLFGDPLTGKHHIGDGWHRFLAHKLSGKKEIAAIVHSGGPAEALKHALGANAEHNALRRTNRDKRKAVTIALKSFPKMSLRELGDLCKVSHQFVAIIKKEVSTVDTKPTTASSGKPAPKPAQIDFFAQLNASFKPVEDGLKEVFSHSYFLNPEVLKKDKLEAITGIEQSLKAKLQEAKDLKAKLAAQEENVGAELVETAENPAPELATA